jgi:hypothetical protein
MAWRFDGAGRNASARPTQHREPNPVALVVRVPCRPSTAVISKPVTTSSLPTLGPKNHFENAQFSTVDSEISVGSFLRLSPRYKGGNVTPVWTKVTSVWRYESRRIRNFESRNRRYESRDIRYLDTA